MKRNLLKTEGVVLRSIPYKESSNILTLFTKEMGKIKVIAKGRRRPKSRLRAPLEMLTVSELIIYAKDDREIQIVKEASLIRSYEIFRENYRRFLFGCRLAQITDTFLEINSPIPEVYNLFIQSLDLISFSPEQTLPSILSGFIIKVLSILGHKPILEKCVKCGGKASLNYISIKEGGTICENCRDKVEDATFYSAKFIRTLRMLLYHPQNTLCNFELESMALEEFLSKYIEHCTGYSIIKGIKNEE